MAVAGLLAPAAPRTGGPGTGPEARGAGGLTIPRPRFVPARHPGHVHLTRRAAGRQTYLMMVVVTLVGVATLVVCTVVAVTAVWVWNCVVVTVVFCTF